MPFTNTKDQGCQKDRKYTSPKQTAGKHHQPRAVTDKFDCYRVPLDQVKNLGGAPKVNAGNVNFGGFCGQQPQQQQYYHFEEKYQAINTGTPAPTNPTYYAVPYTQLQQYNYESYSQQHKQQQTGNPAYTQGQYPLPQMDPNYYHTYPTYGYANIPTVKTGAAPAPAPANYGHAPYASPWTTEERPKSLAPVKVKANDNDDIMQKLDEMHSQMSKMVQMLTEEINTNARNARRNQVVARNVPKLEVGVKQFNLLLAQFNTLCKSIKEQKQQQQQLQQRQPNQFHSLSLASRDETASTAFAANSSSKRSPKISGGKGGVNNYNQPPQSPKSQKVTDAEKAQLAEKMQELNTLYQQAKALGVELHNSMLLSSSSAALPSETQFKKMT